MFPASNVTLRLDCPDETGKIYGSTAITGNAVGWTADGTEFYHALTTACNVVVRDGVILLEDDGGHDGDGVDANKWDWDTTDDRLYVKEDPSGYAAYEVGQLGTIAALVTFPNSDSITDFTIMGGGVGEIRYANEYAIAVGHDSWKNRADDTTTRNYGDCTIDGVLIYAPAKQGIHFNASDNDTGNSTGQGADASNVAEVTWSNTWDNVTITNCKLYSCGGEAIYSGSNINTAFNITDNYITSDPTLGDAGWDNVSDPYSAYAGDGINVSPHGVATITGNWIENVRGTGIVVAFHNGTIADNVIIDAGSDTNDWPTSAHNGIYSDPQITGSEVVIERNLIVYVDRYGKGITLAGASAGITPQTVRNNIVILPWTDSFSAFAVKGQHVDMDISNNTFYGGVYGYYNAGWGDPTTSTFKNNIVERSKYPFYSVRNDQSGFDLTNNNFRSLASGAPAEPYHTNDADYASVAAMDTGEATFSSNTELDPILFDAGGTAAEDYYALKYLKGTDLSATFTTDYNGDTRAGWEPGAFDWKAVKSLLYRDD